MKWTWKWISCVALVITGAVTLGTTSVESHRPSHPPPPPSPPPAPVVEVFTRELDNPRGLAFGPDGKLYVSEAGSGGTESTADVCPELQIGPPFGPYVNGRTARISRIDRRGVRQTVVDGLPSGQTVVPDWQGVADVAFIDHRQLLEVRLDGRTRIVVDFTAQFGHIAPSALAQAGPLLIVGNIFQFPIVDGASGLFVVAPQILADRSLTAQPSGFAAPANAGASDNPLPPSIAAKKLSPD